MQRIQNIAGRLVYQLPEFFHVNPLFMELHWLPVKYRVEFKVLLLTFKAIHCKDSFPKYICDMFTVRLTGHYSTRSQNKPITLCVPKHTLAIFQARSLPVAGAIFGTVWPMQLEVLPNWTILEPKSKHISSSEHMTKSCNVLTCFNTML